MLKHVINIGWTSVRLSVCHTLVLYQNGWTYCHAFSPHDSPFILVLCVSNLREIPTGSPPVGPLNRGRVWKYRNFRPITCYISKTVEGRWVHAARRLTSTEEFFFDPCNIYRDCPRGVHRGGQNVLKWRIFKLPAWITGKRLKIDR